ncbi:MAG: hypothetical protein GX444_18330 [Myxococcales bacterium]|nr:hypothetical protein [Myxococcales bacterium]
MTGLVAVSAIGIAIVVIQINAPAVTATMAFATVNERPLPLAELRTALAEAGAMRTGEPFDRIVRKVANDLIDAELINQRFAGEYSDATDKRDVVRRVLAARVHQGIEVSDEEIAAYFDRNLKGKTNLGPDQYRLIVRKQIVLEKERARYNALVAELRAGARIELFEDRLPR